MFECCCEREEQNNYNNEKDDPDKLQKRPPQRKRDKSKLLKDQRDVVGRDEVLKQIEWEVETLFKTFDVDGDGTINAGKELDGMIIALKQRGYHFGRRMTPGVDYFPESWDKSTRKKKDVMSMTEFVNANNEDPLLMNTNEENADTNNEADTTTKRGNRGSETETSGQEGLTDESCYQTVLSARVKLNMLATMDGFAKELSKREFHDWLLFELCSRRTNLRILLQDNELFDKSIEKIFENVDEDMKGTVFKDELRGPITQIAVGLGEPPPSSQWLKKFLRHFQIVDGQLNEEQFKHVLVEAATRLFHSHFNESMHPHHTADLPHSPRRSNSSLGNTPRSPRRSMTPRS